MTSSAVRTGIRRAEPADVPLLSSLVEQYWRFEQLPGFERTRIEGLLGELIRNPRHGAAWVATQGQTLLGYLLVVHVFSLENGGPTAEIDEFFVNQAARGLGIGAMLLAEAETVLRAEGCRSIALQLGTANEAGRAFYTRHGYARREGYDMLEKRL